MEHSQRRANSLLQADPNPTWMSPNFWPSTESKDRAIEFGEEMKRRARKPVCLGLCQGAGERPVWLAEGQSCIVFLSTSAV